MQSHLQPEIPSAVASSSKAAPAGAEEFQRKPTDHLYWAKTSSVNAAPPPKALSAEEAKKLEQASAAAGGSAWNKGGNTWEEKKIEKWAHELLKEELLPMMEYDLPTATGPLPALPASDEGATPDAMHVRLLSADKVQGECTYVLSRGKQRVVFELELKLKLEVEVKAAGSLCNIITGTVSISEVTNDDLGDAKLPGHKCTCDQGGWKPAFEYAAKLCWPSLKASLETLVERAKEKWR